MWAKMQKALIYFMHMRVTNNVCSKKKREIRGSFDEEETEEKISFMFYGIF